MEPEETIDLIYTLVEIVEEESPSMQNGIAGFPNLSMIIGLIVGVLFLGFHHGTMKS